MRMILIVWFLYNIQCLVEWFRFYFFFCFVKKFNLVHPYRILCPLYVYAWYRHCTCYTLEMEFAYAFLSLPEICFSIVFAGNSIEYVHSEMFAELFPLSQQ